MAFTRSFKFPPVRFAGMDMTAAGAGAELAVKHVGAAGPSSSSPAASAQPNGAFEGPCVLSFLKWK